MTLTRRERVRAATIVEIKEIARQHMVEKGAASISLRAIAREMGMTSPALYRYFDSRDDLVTALIVDAYNSLAEALEAGREAYPAGQHGDRLAAVAYAYRDWTLAHPQEYALIFGTPIPGYHAPMEITSPAAGRAMNAILGSLDAAHRAGKLDLANACPLLSPEHRERLQPWADELNFTGDLALVHLALASWGLVHGLVSLEIFGHLHPTSPFEDATTLYRTEILAWLKRLGLNSELQM